MENKVINGTDKLVLNAKEYISFNNITVGGQKASGSNAKILFDSAELEINGATIEQGSTVYNVFEQKSGTVQFPIKSVKAKNITCINDDLTHNILNFFKCSCIRIWAYRETFNFFF